MKVLTPYYTKIWRSFNGHIFAIICLYRHIGYLPRKYKFQWIEYIGTEIIEEVEVQAGGQTLQKISGTAINLMAHRDVSSKKLLYDEMIGHRLELYNPEFAQNNGYYPMPIIIMKKKVLLIQNHL